MPGPDRITLGSSPSGKAALGWLIVASMLVLVLAACEEPPAPTPTPAAAPESGSGLLEKLSLLPAEFKDIGIWYGDMGRALEMAGLEPPRSREDLAQSESVRDAYVDATRGIYLAPALPPDVYFNPEWGEVFGFNGYEIRRAVGFGGSPLGLANPLSSESYLEGDFDDAANPAEAPGPRIRGG